MPQLPDKNPFKKQFLSDGEQDEPQTTRRKLKTIDTERGLLSDSPAVNDIEFSPNLRQKKQMTPNFDNLVLITKDEKQNFGNLGVRKEP